jgi:catechol 2,3-dioxygenase-like lactoylglutathione lyase family enzyme
VITGFHHFEISTQDPDRAIAFYRDVFGMQVVAEREVEAGGFVEEVTGVPGARVRIVHLQGYGFNFELLHYIEPGGDARAREPNHAGSAHLCFISDDLDAECERLRALGVKVRSRDGGPIAVIGGPNDGGKAIYLEDPDGNAVEIVQLVRPWPGTGN